MITLYTIILIAVFSAVSIFLYWRDKRAARMGLWRVSESTLHLVSLLGGWPGAWLAQKMFRHKTVKQPFRAVFVFTIILNLALVFWIHTSGVEKEILKLIPESVDSSIKIEWSDR